MLLKDYLINHLISLQQNLIVEDNEESMFQILDEIEIISQRINTINQLMSDSLFDMDRTIKKFLKINIL